MYKLFTCEGTNIAVNQLNERVIGPSIRFIGFTVNENIKKSFTVFPWSLN